MTNSLYGQQESTSRATHGQQESTSRATHGQQKSTRRVPHGQQVGTNRTPHGQQVGTSRTACGQATSGHLSSPTWALHGGHVVPWLLHAMEAGTHHALYRESHLKYLICVVACIYRFSSPITVEIFFMKKMLSNISGKWGRDVEYANRFVLMFFLYMYRCLSKNLITFIF